MPKFFYIFVCLFLGTTILATNAAPRIRSIVVEGNRYATTDAIKSRLPYRENTFFDSYTSSEALDALYQMGFFKQIYIEKEDVGVDEVDLFITVVEKNRLEKIKCKGNHTLSKKKIIEILKLENVEMIDEEDLEYLKRELLTAYRDEGHYFATVNVSLVYNDEATHKVTLHFDISEGVKSHVIRVDFKGNTLFNSDKLRSVVNTRERWILSMLDGSGRYNPELVEFDKHILSRFYQDHGYLQAKVVDVEVVFSEDKKEIYITYVIEERKIYTVTSVSAPGDEIISEEELKPYITIQKDRPYSVSDVQRTIENLRSLWTDKGYLHADIYPHIKPDEESGTVEIIFYCEHGNKVSVNRIDITGNKITKDSLIRRQINFQEGEIITAEKLERAKASVERLSYFEQGGVNWKMHRIDDSTTDLELHVQEAKTGNASLSGSYGSQENSNLPAFRLKFEMEKRNFLGEGIDVGTQAAIQLARHGSQFFEGHIFKPYLFDSKYSGRLALYHKKQEFTEWRNVTPTPTLMQLGGVGNLVREFSLWRHLIGVDLEVGGEWVRREKRWIKDPENPTGAEIHTTNLTARGGNADEVSAFQKIIDSTFPEGYVQWFGVTFALDTRNHRIYPTEGYRLMQSNKLALPFLNQKYAFFKAEIDASYYTPLIGTDSLVLALRGRAGTVYSLSGKDIPYTDLFNIGGQTSVRGFVFGSIGPSWKNQDPLGAKHALIFNAEIIFPLLRAYQMKGHLFYDAGAGWSSPLWNKTQPNLITRNSFNIRHAVGFGINLVHPQPIKIDWGFKLDRDKRTGESSNEMHISANIAF